MGVMIVDACCNFRLPREVSTHRTACTVAMFVSSDDGPACGHPDSGAGESTLSDFFPKQQCEGLEDLTMSPVPSSRVRVNNVEGGGVHTQTHTHTEATSRCVFKATESA